MFKKYSNLGSNQRGECFVTLHTKDGAKLRVQFYQENHHGDYDTVVIDVCKNIEKYAPLAVEDVTQAAEQWLTENLPQPPYARNRRELYALLRAKDESFKYPVFRHCGYVVNRAIRELNAYERAAGRVSIFEAADIISEAAYRIVNSF